MLFNSFTYMFFLTVMFALYWAFPDRHRKTLLLAGSYVFYMTWKAEYGLLILALTLINFFIGRQIDKHTAVEKRKQILVLGLWFNLGCLCFFKYSNFLIDSLFQCLKLGNGALHFASADFSSPALNIILPLGISFFTFEFIHYIVDVYRGSKPVKSFTDFALFASFFPSQIAGPIKRFQDFMHQLEEKPVFKNELFGQGIFLIMQGFFKKVVLGDNMGIIVSQGFNHVGNLPLADAWLATAGFTFQIFFDFSGYTDIGRGSALLFGYKVPENFNLPFLAANLTDFWRRWHMSLSTWLRDYLFIPMGGSKGGAWNARRNVFLTMVLGGLWHGAAWHYVIWGAFHGSGLVISKEWQDLVSRNKTLSALRPTPLWHYSGMALTIFFLFLAGILFRANDLPQALSMTARLLGNGNAGLSGAVLESFLRSTLVLTLPAYTLFVALRSKKAATLFAGSGLTLIKDVWQNSFALRLAACASLAVIISGFAPGQLSPFIYFQF
ncbi:MAG: MBOAT family protein [Cyanobacteria bacterium SZAS LIN-2]|nr:MBOAT family protein [Cyanobacteria bacterium SZAS LIN-2]